MSTTCPEPQRGFAIAAAIFILVALAALAGFIVATTTTQNLSFAQDLQGARAYQAARAGIDWGIQRWLSATPSAAALCPAAASTLTFTDPGPAEFTTTVRATLSSSAGVSFCAIEATAAPGGLATDSPGYVERKLRAVVEAN